MSKWEWREISIENGQVRELHRIDDHRFPCIMAFRNEQT